MTLRKLNSTSYSDNNMNVTGRNDFCVLPKEHLPIYNRSKNMVGPLDFYNEVPLPDSLGYMRPTEGNETPSGLVIDLRKHNERSFAKLLDEAYKIYDKEFFDEQKRLKDEIEKWKDIKRGKERQLETLKNEVSSTQNQYDRLLDYNSECQRNKRELDSLKDLHSRLTTEDTNAVNNIANAKAEWRCMYSEKKFVPLRRNTQGDIECLSGNARDCSWTNALSQCRQAVNNTSTVSPLVCGSMVASIWGGRTGYDVPGHWCADGQSSI
jgi:hypothetical protein